jgi:hypothetical protein
MAIPVNVVLVTQDNIVKSFWGQFVMKNHVIMKVSVKQRKTETIIFVLVKMGSLVETAALDSYLVMLVHV